MIPRSWTWLGLAALAGCLVGFALAYVLGRRARAQLDRRWRDRYDIQQRSTGERDQQLVKLRQSLADHESVALRLTGRVSELEPLVPQLQSREQALKQLRARLEATGRDLNEKLGALHQLTSAHQLLRAQAAQAAADAARRQEEIERGWRSRLAEAEAIATAARRAAERAPVPVAPQLAAPVPDPPVADVAAPTSALAPETVPGAPLLAAEPLAPADGDDLKAIRGIGPHLAARLHSLGIHHYRDIALWDETAIDRVDAALGAFRGRIRRDAWVESARALHERKYGVAP